MFTWNSIGIVDEQSLQNMTFEAWVRTPVTIINKNITDATLLTSSDNQVYYLGRNKNIIQLVYGGNGWGYNNLTT